MANKYIIHGATFNGDGTTSAAATSNGGVGAWNTITYFQNTTPAFGALVGGDTVYIRSRSAAGANILTSHNVNISLGASAATLANKITWVIDDGTTWPGISGEVRYTATGSNSVTFLDNNDVICLAQDALAINCSITNPSAFTSFGNGCVVDGLLVERTLQNTSNVYYLQIKNAILKNLHYITSGASTSGIRPFNVCTGILINPNIEVTGNSGGALVFTTHIANVAGARLLVHGGRISGFGADNGAAIFGGAGGSYGVLVELIGTQFPSAMPLTVGATAAGQVVTAFAADGKYGSAMGTKSGVVDSRYDGFYPTLNARFPDTIGTPWSWKIYPVGAALDAPITLNIAKLYTSAAATKTLTLNLVSDSRITSSLTANTLYMDVIYIDSATGLSKTVRSTAVNTSTEAWSTLTYGPASFDRLSLSVTTPTTIKQDTEIITVFYCAYGAVAAADILFVCPSVVAT